LVTVHSFTEDERFRSAWQRQVIASWADPVTLRTATAAHCVSRYGSEKSAFRQNVRHDLGWIDNAVPTREAPGRDEAVRREFGFAPEDVVALCVSRLTREKGIQDLIRAMHGIAIRGKAQPRLLLVGDGPELDTFRQSAEPLLSAGRIVMTGRRNDVFRLLGAADFFVLPSLHENQSLAILEAMMAEKAVVATRVGGTPELVDDGRSGVLCPASAPKALADAMIAVAEDAALRERLGGDGRKRALSDFSLERFVRRMSGAYEETLRLARGASSKTRSDAGRQAAASQTRGVPPGRVPRQLTR
jgi:glycosyltransferase involved in cell wall biosynthesis